MNKVESLLLNRLYGDSLPKMKRQEFPSELEDLSPDQLNSFYNQELYQSIYEIDNHTALQDSQEKDQAVASLIQLAGYSKAKKSFSANSQFDRLALNPLSFDVFRKSSRKSLEGSALANSISLSQAGHFIEENQLPEYGICATWLASNFFPPYSGIEEAVHSSFDQKQKNYSYQGLTQEQDFKPIVDWLKERFAWNTQSSWHMFGGNTQFAITQLVDIFTKPSDPVFVFTPTYGPLIQIPIHLGRQVEEVPLKQEQSGCYTIDFATLCERIKAYDATIQKTIILCHPHNPTGRSWNESELAELAQICEDYDLLVISDELWADLSFVQHRFFASVNSSIADRTITLHGPSKSFNLSGLHQNYISISNPRLREKVVHRYLTLGLLLPNFFTLALQEKIYSTKGKLWIDNLNSYLKDNINFFAYFTQEFLSEVRFNAPDATYLLWLDFSQSRYAGDSFKPFLQSLSRGGFVCQGGETFFGTDQLRTSVALPKLLLALGLSRLYRTYNAPYYAIR